MRCSMARSMDVVKPVVAKLKCVTGSFIFSELVENKCNIIQKYRRSAVSYHDVIKICRKMLINAFPTTNT